MSNFTKSVIYSTAVLAIGLVGIVAISSQRDGSTVSGIEPAAGQSDMGLDFSNEVENGEQQAETAPEAGNVIEEAQEGMNEAIEAAGDEPIEKSAPQEAAAQPDSAPIAAEEEAPAETEAAAIEAPEVAEESEQPVEGAVAAEIVEGAKEIAPAAGATAETASDAAEKAQDTAKDIEDELGLEE